MTTQALSPSSIICMARHNRRSMMQAWNSPAAASDATEFLHGMHHESASTTEQALRKDQFLRLPESRLTLECLSGRLWLTREGDPDDFFLEAGELMDISPEEDVVVQALLPSQVRWQVA